MLQLMLNEHMSNVRDKANRYIVNASPPLKTVLETAAHTMDLNLHAFLTLLHEIYKIKDKAGQLM